MGLLRCSLLALVAFVASVKGEVDVAVEDDVYVLDDKNFDAFIAAHEFVLAEFYAPWCGHCKTLAPEYAKAAEQLKEENSKAVLAKIDAQANAELGKRFDISGFPTLKFFRSGTPTPYSGGRQAAEIVAWVKKKTGPPSILIEKKEDLEKLKESEEVLVFGFFKDLSSKETKDFLDAAGRYDEITFAHAVDPAIRDAISPKENVVLFKHFDEKRNDMEDPLNVESILRFVMANSRPHVMPLTMATQSKVFNGDIKSHMLLMGTNNHIAKMSDCFTETAKIFKGKLAFVTVDLELEGNNHLAEYFQIPTNELSLRLIHLGEDVVKYVPDEKITCDMLKPYAQDYVDGKLKPHFRSDDIPADWDAAPVKVLVGKNFEEVALNPKKNVFILFYAPWCSHCKSIMPTWEKLAEHYQNNEDIIIAKIDSTTNDIENVSVSSFPTIKLVKKGDNQIVEFKGDRDFTDFTKFINKHLGLEGEDEEDSDKDDTTHDEL